MKTNIEKAAYSMQQICDSGIANPLSPLIKAHRDDAIAYALIAIAETLAQINEKMPSRSPATAVYTPPTEG